MTIDPLDVAMAATEALESASIECAIGGALALGIWGVPRATLDVDLNLFVEHVEIPRAVVVLRSIGLEVEVEVARSAAESEGWFSGKLLGYRIDVFVPSIPFAEEARRTRQHVALEGRRVPFLSMEALAVFEMLFFRAKDLVDLERLLAVAPELDRDYVRRALVDMMGEEDVRIGRWDELVRG